MPKLIKPHTPVLLLSVYMFVVAVMALIRTGSYVPLIIAGTFAILTLIVGIIAKKNSRTAINIAISWVIIVFIVEAYMTFNTTQVHGNDRTGSAYIFGSVAILALLALFFMIFSIKKQSQKK